MEVIVVDAISRAPVFRLGRHLADGGDPDVLGPDVRGGQGASFPVKAGQCGADAAQASPREEHKAGGQEAKLIFCAAWCGRLAMVRLDGEDLCFKCAAKRIRR